MAGKRPRRVTREFLMEHATHFAVEHGETSATAEIDAIDPDDDVRLRDRWTDFKGRYELAAMRSRWLVRLAESSATHSL